MSAIKTTLTLVLKAGDVIVAESTDGDLWQRALAEIVALPREQTAANRPKSVDQK